MALRSVIESYALEIVGRAQAGEARCRRLIGAPFISESPALLAETLRNIFVYLARVTRIIAEQIDWNGDSDKIDKDVTVLRVLDWQLKEFAAHIRYVESARTDRLPWQAIPAFENLVNHLKPGAKVMLRPMWHYNYATVVSNLRDLYLSQLKEYEFFTPDTDISTTVIAPLDPAFHIISFPALERHNILLHSVIGHELGHLVATDLTERFAPSFLTDARQQIELVTEDQLKALRITPDTQPLLYQQYRTTLIRENSERCLVFWTRAMEEILADVLGAVLFGPAALFSTLEIAVQISFDIPPSEDNNYYPPWRRRIREVLRVVDHVAGDLLVAKPEFFRMDAPRTLHGRAKDLGLSKESRASFVNERVSTIRELSADQSDEHVVNRDPLAKTAYAHLRGYVDAATTEIKAILGKRAFNQKQHGALLPAVIERLDAGIPPNAEHDMPSRKLSRISIVDVLNSAWYQKTSLAVAPVGDADRVLLEKTRDQRNRLTLKAIEYSFLAGEFHATAVRQPPTQPTSHVGGVLTSDDIHDFMERAAILDRIIVTPLLEPSESLGPAAVDVRLGTEFVLFRKEAFNSLDVGSVETLVGDVGRYQEKVVCRIKQPFVLHPRQLVIGSTLEYVQVPPTLMAYVIGKSTWGRTGLVIATATKVDPGFRGCITLEIINEGEVPLVLYPGLPIAQLVFHRTERAGQYAGTYTCPIGPEFPKFDSIVDDAQFWLPEAPARRRNR